MNDNEFTVSICCITYNQEDYIAEAINGFLCQKTTFKIEILIHDDASTDSTAKIIQKYKDQYPDLIKPIFQTENQWSKGQRINPKFNFPRAIGKYIAICEGDDVWTDPLKLQRQVEALEEDKNVIITYTDCVAFSDAGILGKNFGGATRDTSALELETCVSLYTPTVCFRNIFKKNQFPEIFDRAYYGDLAIWSFLGEFGYGKYIDSVSPTKYRVRKGGLHSMAPRNLQLKRRLTTLTTVLKYKAVKKRFIPVIFLAIEILKTLVKYIIELKKL